MKEFTFSVERVIQKSGVMTIQAHHLTPSDMVSMLNEGSLCVQPCREPGSRGFSIHDGERVVATFYELTEPCEAGERRYSGWSMES